MKLATKHKRKAWCVVPGSCPLKTPESDIRKVQIIHHDLIARFVDGMATSDDLKDLMETWFTYTIMMELYAEEGTTFTDDAKAVMQTLGEILPNLHARHAPPACISLNAQEMDIAKSAAAVMDELIAMDRHGIALRAAIASAARLQQLPKGVHAR